MSDGELLIPRRSAKYPSKFVSSMRLLFWLNLSASLAHIGVAATILAVGLRRDTDLFMRALYVPTQTWNPVTKSLVPSYPLSPTTRFNLPVAVALFSMISATFHMVYATGHFSSCSHRFYWRFMWKLRGNPLRWIEYFFSASLMMGLIAYSFGSNDIDLLVAVSGLLGVSMIFGHVTEREAVRCPSRHWASGRLYYHWFGWIPMILAWAPLTHKFISAVQDSGSDTPRFVIAIFVVELVLFSMFAVGQIWHMSKVDDKFRPTIQQTIRVEILMLILSFTAKTSLAFLSAAIVFF